MKRYYKLFRHWLMQKRVEAELDHAMALHRYSHQQLDIANQAFIEATEQLMLAKHRMRVFNRPEGDDTGGV